MSFLRIPMVDFFRIFVQFSDISERIFQGSLIKSCFPSSLLNKYVCSEWLIIFVAVKLRARPRRS